MQFEWDANKNKSNVRKHGIRFEQAQFIFDGPTIDAVDDRQNYDETRIISLGLLDDTVVLSVVHTDRAGRTRLISARKASRKERMIYYGAVQTTTDS